MKTRNLGRRIITLLMVLIMLVGNMPLAAFAEGETVPMPAINTYVEAANRQFDGQVADLLTVKTDSKPTDVILQYTYNGVTTATIPQASEIGDHVVTVGAFMNDILVATQVFTVTIGGNGISAVPLQQKYDGITHQVVAISGAQPEDVIEYSTDNGGSWVTTCPTLTDVGMMTAVAVRVTRAGTPVFVKYGLNAQIIQNDMLQLAYKQDGLTNHGVLEYPAGSTTIDLGVKYAYDNHPTDLTIEYGARAIRTVSRDNGTTDRGMTVNAETGVITLQKGDVHTEAGLYEIYAHVIEPEGKNNYTESAKSLTQFVVVYDTPELTFLQEQLNYILGTTAGEGGQGKVNADVPGLIASGLDESAVIIPNNSTPVYSIACATQGSNYETSVSMDANTGKFTVDNTMLNHIGSSENGIIESYTVKAELGESTYDFGTQNSAFTSIPVEIGVRKVYGKANATYTLNILQSNLSGEDVTKAYKIQEEAINGWYGGNGASVTVTAEEGYMLAKEGDEEHVNELTFVGDGDEHYLFIKNEGQGVVSGMTRLLDAEGNPVKIDSTKPEDFKIVYTKVSVLDIIAEVLSFGFKKSGVTVTISASDIGSGVDGIKIWSPYQEKDILVSVNGDSSVLPKDSENPLEISNKNEDKTSFSAELVITASDVSEDLVNTGLLNAQVIDLAGNVKEGFDSQTVYTNSATVSGGDNMTVVTDPDAPQISVVSMTAYDQDNAEVAEDASVDYVEDKVAVTRFGKNVHSVNYTFQILDDTLSHGETVVKVTDQDGEVVNAGVTWTDITDGKQGSFRISGDGEYLITVSACDKANNDTLYAHKLVLDTAAPVVDITANINEGQVYKNVGYTNADIVYTITVDDVHFDEENVDIFCEKDGTAFTAYELDVWTLVEGGKHRATVTIKDSQANNGNYTLKVSSSDGISDEFICNTVDKTFETPIVLDTQNPMVTLTYTDGQKSKYYSFQERIAQIQVTDKHLADTVPAEDIIKDCIIATDICGNVVQDAVTADTSHWATDSVLTLSFNKEANYQVDILNGDLIKDLAGNKAVSGSSYEDEFTLDYTAPNAPGQGAGTVLVEINIKDANKGTSSAGNWWERVVNGVKKLFGYWNGNITVTVTAEDRISGLTEASYSYTPALGVTKTGTVTLKQSEEDLKSFSATFNLPSNLFDSENEQLNGRITVWLNDRCGNEVSMADQGWHIVYDTINPQMVVSYETCVNEPEDEQVMYFAEPATVRIKMLEEHFEPEMLTICDKGDEVAGLEWNKETGEDGNIWNATSFVIGKSGEEPVDAEHKITIEGQDFAGNAIKGEDGKDIDVYTSKILIVDPTPPKLIEPGVSSGTLKRTTDTTEYYMDPTGVHFSFKVEEKNFKDNTISVLIQKNGISATLNQDYTLHWTNDGDVHTADIHFTQDGEYSISISGKDPAGNKMEAGKNAVVTDGKYEYAKTIVLDNAAPKISLTYEPVDVQAGSTKNGKQYISGNVLYTLTVEDNFLNAVTDSEDCSGVYLQIGKTKEGTLSEETKAITADMFDKAAAKNRGKETVYTYTWTEQDEAEYEIEAFYTDYVYRNVDAENDHDYTVSSKPENIAVIDKTTPKLSVVYADGLMEQYYNLDDLKTEDNQEGYRRAEVIITERNLDTDVVNNKYLLSDTFLSLTDVTGTSIKTDDSVQIEKQEAEANGINHVWDLVFAAEANYVFDLLLKDENGKTVIQDLAGNELVLAENIESVETVFTIDRTAPSAEAPSQEGQETETGPGTLHVTYNIPTDENGEEKWYTNLWEKIRFGFWKEMIEITISCYEEIAGIDPDAEFTYTFTRAETVEQEDRSLFVSTLFNADTFEGKIKFTQGESGEQYSAVVRLPEDVLITEAGEGILEETAQLNGTFSITLADRCKNESKYNGKPESADDEEIRLIYDTISPTREVTFGPVANTKDDKTYFAADIVGTVRVEEANFFIENGKTDIINTGFETGWISEDADSHVGTFKITGEGEHTVTITGKDYAGNEMDEWKSEKLIIDTQITPPVITVNSEEADGKAFKDDVMLGITFFDDNFRDVEVQILRTKLDEKDVDVSDILVKTEELDEDGGMIFYDPLEKLKDNDGIYVVSVTMRDWANHESTTTATFSVNRFGSVYTYGDYLMSIIRDGGLYINEVSEDLEIHEFNSDRLVGDVKIQITRDGKPVDEILYTSNALQNDIAVGESGWYEYTHIIKKENFTEDGLYKISISSQDYAGNTPENTNMEGMSIQFYVDSTLPELTSVTGLEKAIVNAEAVDVKFVAYDTMGLKSVKVYLDGELVEETTELPDRNNYNGGLQLTESDKTQTVRIVLEDLAGNILDTGAEGFESAYTMVQGITVSTDFWVRFLANKPLLYGCIITLVIIAAGVGIGVPTVIAIKKKGKYSKIK